MNFVLILLFILNKWVVYFFLKHTNSLIIKSYVKELKVKTMGAYSINEFCIYAVGSYVETREINLASISLIKASPLDYCDIVTVFVFSAFIGFCFSPQIMEFTTIEELDLKIFSLLGPSDLMRACLVSRSWCRFGRFSYFLLFCYIKCFSVAQSV